MVSQDVFVLCVSGNKSFANPSAPGAAITLAAIKWFAGTPKNINVARTEPNIIEKNNYEKN